MAGKEVQIRLPEEQMKQYMKLHAEDERLGDNLGKVTAQLELELRNRKTKFITRKEVMRLNESTPVYKACGKAFILDDVPNTKQNLRDEIAASDKKILMIKKTGIYIVSQQDGVKLQIQELVKPYLKQ